MVFVGGSMEPTYRSGQIAMTVRTDGRFQRGDVVVVQRPEGPIVKRVAFVPGDPLMQVSSAQGWITVLYPAKLRKAHPKGIRYVPVPEGQVYVIGDNLALSYDSRDFGPVSLKSITAEVVNAIPPGKAWSTLVNDENRPKTW